MVTNTMSQNKIPGLLTHAQTVAAHIRKLIREANVCDDVYSGFQLRSNNYSMEAYSLSVP